MEDFEIKTSTNYNNWAGIGIVDGWKAIHEKWLETSRGESAVVEADKNDAEAIVKMMESPDPESARESTEKWRVYSPEEVKKLLENVSPERRRIIGEAMKYMGVNNEKDPAIVKNFFKHCRDASYEKNKNLWCMVFVNQVLSDSGKVWSNKSGAVSGLSIGKSTKTPEPGDLIVVKRAEWNHIGFFLWLSESGNPIIIWWNQWEKGEVSIKEETRPIRWYQRIV